MQTRRGASYYIATLCGRLYLLLFVLFNPFKIREKKNTLRESRCKTIASKTEITSFFKKKRAKQTFFFRMSSLYESYIVWVWKEKYPPKKQQ